MMKRIEKFLVVILILTVISIIGSYFSNVLLARLYGPTEYGKMTAFSKLIAIIPSFFRILVNICVAVWLYGVARKHKTQPWVWFVFGIFFGLMAAVLFYLIRIYDMLKSESRNEEKT